MSGSRHRQKAGSPQRPATGLAKANEGVALAKAVQTGRCSPQRLTGRRGNVRRSVLLLLGVVPTRVADNLVKQQPRLNVGSNGRPIIGSKDYPGDSAARQARGNFAPWLRTTRNRHHRKSERRSDKNDNQLSTHGRITQHNNRCIRDRNRASVNRALVLSSKIYCSSVNRRNQLGTAVPPLRFATANAFSRSSRRQTCNRRPRFSSGRASVLKCAQAPQGPSLQLPASIVRRRRRGGRHRYLG
jgi:hypothetical protein